MINKLSQTAKNSLPKKADFRNLRKLPATRATVSQLAKASRDTQHGFANCESFTRHAAPFRKLRKHHAEREEDSQGAKGKGLIYINRIRITSLPSQIYTQSKL